jgi:hypothetical protein
VSVGARGWVWLLAVVPLAVAVVGIVSALALHGVRKYMAEREASRAAAAVEAPPATGPGPVPELAGAAVDLSTVMGRARKLANEWQREAALLGIEATLSGGKIQTRDGARAKVTFGPSPFDSTHARSGLFVVTYDQSGISGAATKGTAGHALPEPMCAPEHVLARVTDLGEGPLTLRYAEDASDRPMWLVNPQPDPKRLRLVDPQTCQLRGLLAPARQR